MAKQVTATRQVFDRHAGALLSGDLERVLADYTDGSVIISSRGVLQGLDAIREMFAGYFATLLKPGTYTLEADSVQVDGDIAFVLWHASCQGAEIPFATDTFVIRDGKIAVQTIAAKIEPHS